MDELGLGVLVPNPRYQFEHDLPEGVARAVNAARDSIAETIKGTPADGVILRDVDLTTGDTTVPHKLGRQPEGYVVIDRTDGKIFFRKSWDDKHIVFTSSGVTVASLLVF
jgi:hypothetical protein